MGTVTVTIEIGDPQGQVFEELDVIVDTGSTYTAVPRQMLQRLGIPVERALPIRNRRRQDRSCRRRRSHDQAGKPAVPHARDIRRGQRAQPDWA